MSLTMSIIHRTQQISNICSNSADDSGFLQAVTKYVLSIHDIERNRPDAEVGGRGAGAFDFIVEIRSHGIMAIVFNG